MVQIVSCKSILKAVERAQWVNCSIHQHKALSSDPQNSHKAGCRGISDARAPPARWEAHGQLACE